MHKHKVLHHIQMMNNRYTRYILYLGIYIHLLHTFYMYTQMMKLLIYLCMLRHLEVQSVDIYYNYKHLIHSRQLPIVQNLNYVLG